MSGTAARAVADLPSAEVEVIREIGKGSFGTVMLCRRAIGDEDDVEYIAVKQFDKAALRKCRELIGEGDSMVWRTALERVEIEMAIMKQLEHPNIVAFHEAIDDGSSIFMLLEFVDGGQLMRFSAEQRRYVPAQCVLDLAQREDPSFRVGQILPEALLRRLFRGIVEGVEYIHTHFLVHRDLKPENVLVTKAGTCKLADFGCAHSFSEEDEAAGALRVTRTEGTPQFFAPECVTGEPFDPFAVDAWALGVNLYALVFGELPVDGADAASVFEALQHFRSVRPQGCSPALCDLLEQLLHPDPARRLAVSDVMDHRWMKEGTPMPMHRRRHWRALSITPRDIEAAFSVKQELTLKGAEGVTKLRRSRQIREQRLRALKAAATAGDLEVLHRVLDALAGALNATDDGLPDNDHCAALHHAAACGRVLAMQLLISRGADVDVRCQNDREGDEAAATAQRAAEGWRAQEPEEAIPTPMSRSRRRSVSESGASLPWSVKGDTPLHVAARAGQAEACSLLLEAGANPRATNACGQRPADVAIGGSTRTALVEAQKRRSPRPRMPSVRWTESPPNVIALRDNPGLGSLEEEEEEEEEEVDEDEAGEDDSLRGLGSTDGGASSSQDPGPHSSSTASFTVSPTEPADESEEGAGNGASGRAAQRGARQPLASNIGLMRKMRARRRSRAMGSKRTMAGSQDGVEPVHALGPPPPVPAPPPSPPPRPASAAAPAPAASTISTPLAAGAPSPVSGTLDRGAKDDDERAAAVGSPHGAAPTPQQGTGDAPPPGMEASGAGAVVRVNERALAATQSTLDYLTLSIMPGHVLIPDATYSVTGLGPQRGGSTASTAAAPHLDSAPRHASTGQKRRLGAARRRRQSMFAADLTAPQQQQQQAGIAPASDSGPAAGAAAPGGVHAAMATTPAVASVAHRLSTVRVAVESNHPSLWSTTTSTYFGQSIRSDGGAVHMPVPPPLRSRGANQGRVREAGPEARPSLDVAASALDSGRSRSSAALLARGASARAVGSPSMPGDFVQGSEAEGGDAEPDGPVDSQRLREVRGGDGGGRDRALSGQWSLHGAPDGSGSPPSTSARFGDTGLQGWLWKEGQDVMRRMRRRYCLIEGTRLRYSAEGPGAGKDAPQAWKGEIDLQAVLSVNATSGGGEGRRRALYRFQLRTAGRVWNLAAELETDRAMWIKELRRVLA